MASKRYLPSDVSSDIHQIFAKAIARRYANGLSLIFTPQEMHEAADAEFEYDLRPDGTMLFRPARD